MVRRKASTVSLKSLIAELDLVRQGLLHLWRRQADNDNDDETDSF